MKAAEHTEWMIQGWVRIQVHRADLAIRRRDGAMIWQRDLSLESLPLGWARAENAHGAEIYIRPARGFDWPLAFLDDVPIPLARQLARDHGAMVVQTSPEGGCHIWLPCAQLLDEHARFQVQRWLAERLGADQGSVSGEHLGRLAGFKNWKRGGCWINVLCEMKTSSLFTVPSWPQSLESPEKSLHATVSQKSFASATAPSGAGDGSPSGLEWGWVCRLLEAGRDPEQVYQLLVDRAASRRGADVERYSRRTVARALERVNGTSRFAK